jgi:hypothetical protein
MIGLILGLAILGVILYFIETLPMDPTIKVVIRVVVIVCVILWLLGQFGFVDLPLPRGRRLLN